MEYYTVNGGGGDLFQPTAKNTLLTLCWRNLTHLLRWSTVLNRDGGEDMLSGVKVETGRVFFQRRPLKVQLQNRTTSHECKVYFNTVKYVILGQMTKRYTQL